MPSLKFVLTLFLLTLVAGGLLASTQRVQADDTPSETTSNDTTQTAIRTMLGGEYWFGEPLDDAYIDYLRAVQPDVVHLSVVGPELASVIVEPDRAKAITTIQPSDVTSMATHHAWWKAYLKKLHEASPNTRVQATISLTSVWGDHESNAGWFRYYNDHWEADLLGPKPADDVRELMQRDAAGEMIRDAATGWTRYAGSPASPHWRAALKAFAKAAIDIGFDGFQVQFAYAHGPAVANADIYTQQAFRAFLKANYSAAALQAMGIDDVDRFDITHTGPVNQPKYDGANPTANATTKDDAKDGVKPSTPDAMAAYNLAAQAFGAHIIKDCFDEVFIDFGRSIKPDLTLSMWTHHRRFLEPNVLEQKVEDNVDFAKLLDERMLLPIDQWGQGEDYVWYSTPAYVSDLPNNLLGDASLTHKYLRAMAAGTPFVVLKYDYWRWRVTAAEAIAGGGVSFAAWKGGWSGGKDRDDPHMGRYFQFIRDHAAYWNHRTPYADVAMIYPREALFHGDATFLDAFRDLGKALHREHVLFDVVIDQRMTAEMLSRYPRIMLIEPATLTTTQKQIVADYRKSGGVVVDASSLVNSEATASSDQVETTPDTATYHDAARLAKTSTFDLPWTVLVHADVQRDHSRLLIHAVNYNRKEDRGLEQPIPAKPWTANIKLPTYAARPTSVTFHTPEFDEPIAIDFTAADDGRVQFTAPGFVAYGLVVVKWE